MTSSKQLQFYAMDNDALLLCDFVETALRIRYSLRGNFEHNNPVQFDSARSIPSFSKATSPSSVTSQSFLVSLASSSILEREIRLVSGGKKYAFDQLQNPDTLLLTPGGLWESTLLCGQFGIVSHSSIPKDLFRIFTHSMKHTFRRIGSYWVGPNALEYLNNGGRLTIATQSPPEYDLKL